MFLKMELSIRKVGVSENQGRKGVSDVSDTTEGNVIEADFQIRFACLLPLMNFHPFLSGSSSSDVFSFKSPMRTGWGQGKPMVICKV